VTAEEIRKIALVRRRSQSQEEIESKSRKIEEKIFSLPEIEIQKNIMLYASNKEEVQTGGLIKQLLEKKKNLALPRVVRKTKELKIFCPGDIEPAYKGILEPKKKLDEAKPENIDIAIVPGVAFDIYGNRLGYGQGFYDRFLKKLLDIKNMKYIIALAFEIQIFNKLSVTGKDIPVNKLITEQKIRTFQTLSNSF
jgi:5-formyltetrahydrofolate cyclo-ligase